MMPEIRKTPSVARATPNLRANGRKARSCAKTLKAVFHLALQNSASDVAQIGLRITGFAFTPADCQAKAMRANRPKWRNKMMPSIPSQPMTRGGELSGSRAANKTRANPAELLAAANSHSALEGRRISDLIFCRNA